MFVNKGKIDISRVFFSLLNHEESDPPISISFEKVDPPPLYEGGGRVPSMVLDCRRNGKSSYSFYITHNFSVDRFSRVVYPQSV